MGCMSNCSGLYIIAIISIANTKTTAIMIMMTLTIEASVLLEPMGDEQIGAAVGPRCFMASDSSVQTAEPNWA